MCVYVCSVRDWIECMQVCCQSRTTHSSPANTTSSYPHLLYALDSTYLSSHAHQSHTSLVSFPSHWQGGECFRPVVAPAPSSMLVDTGYVSAESSPTSQHSLPVSCLKHPHNKGMMFWFVQQDAGKVEFAPQLTATPLLLPQNPAPLTPSSMILPYPAPLTPTSLLLPSPHPTVTPTSLLLPSPHPAVTPATPLFLPHNPQYWLMLQHSGYLCNNRSRL